MAKSTIKGDIQRNGFLDKSGDGTEGQVRTLNSAGEEVWADTTTGIEEIESDGIRIGDSTVNKLNFKDGTSAALDPLDSTTIEISGESITIEDERIAITGQAAVRNYNFTGLGVTAALDTTDNTTIDITIPGISSGNSGRTVIQTELVATNSADITLPREASTATFTIEKALDEFPSGTSSYAGVPFGAVGNLLYFASGGVDTTNINTLDVTDGTTAQISTTGSRISRSLTITFVDSNTIIFEDRSGTNGGVLVSQNLTTGTQTVLSVTVPGLTADITQFLSSSRIVVGDNMFTYAAPQAQGLGSAATGIYSYSISNDTWTFVAESDDFISGALSLTPRGVTELDGILYYCLNDGIYTIDTNNSNAIAKPFDIVEGQAYIAENIGSSNGIIYFSVDTGAIGNYSYDVASDTITQLLDGLPSGYDRFDHQFSLPLILINNDFYGYVAATLTLNSTTDSGIFKYSFPSTPYTNDIVFDTVTTNTDPAKFNYDTSTGELTITDEIDHDIVVSITVNNSAEVIDTDYRIGILVNDSVIPPQFINTTNNGSTTYEITIPFHNIPGNTYKLVEFVNDVEAYENITTTISAGATLTLNSVEVIGLSDGIFPFVIGDFTSGNELTIEHNLGTENIIGRFKSIDVVPNTVSNIDYEILDSNRIRIASTPFNGRALLIGI